MDINNFLLWLPMIVIAFANAALRERVIIKQYPDIRAQQLSTLMLIILISVYVWFIFPLLKIESGREAFLTGFVWAILTILFEFILGRILNRSWTSLFEQYNILSGRIWPLFLLWLCWLPYWIYLLRGN